MKKLFFFVLLILISNRCFCQKDSTYQHIIAVDVTGLLLNANPGIRYYIDYHHLQFRSGFQFRYSKNTSPTATPPTVFVTSSFTPQLGIAVNHSIRNFSFYAGADAYYVFNYERSNDPHFYNKHYKTYGIMPLIGFSYPIYHQFLVSIETKCSMGYTSQVDSRNQVFKSFNFSLFDSYGILLAYVF